MKQEIGHSVLIAALLTLTLAGCQKKEEPPPPETQAPQASPSESTPMPETPPAPQATPPDSTPSQEPAPGTTHGTSPAQ